MHGLSETTLRAVYIWIDGGSLSKRVQVGHNFDRHIMFGAHPLEQLVCNAVLRDILSGANDQLADLTLCEVRVQAIQAVSMVNLFERYFRQLDD